MDLRGKVALITGAARGIGAETARQLAAKGATVSLVGMEPDLLAALAGTLGDAHRWHECDVTDQLDLDHAVERTVAELGGIDVVIANAGIASNGTVAVTPVEALARVIDVNLTGVIRTVKTALPHVTARRGYVLVVSSAAAIAPCAGMAAYSASKSGVEQFANVLRLEMLGLGVGVGSAHPSWIDTDLVRDVQEDISAFNEMVLSLPGPFGRITSVEECGRAFVRGIERRQRKIFVPGSLGSFAAVRQLFSSAVAENVQGWKMARMLERNDAEVRALGRPFGRHSVESSRDEIARLP